MGSPIELPNGIKRIRKNGKVLFFNPTVPAWIVTNKNGERIINLCNGHRGNSEIAALFQKKYGDKLATDAIRFLAEIKKSRLFCDNRSYIPIKSSNYCLRILQLSLTSSCNLKCIYCYATDREEQGQRKLCFADYKLIIDDAIKISAGLEVVLTGGEPLLCKDCFKIAEYAKNAGSKVQLLTNGTLINKDNIQQIAKLFSLVKISIDGSTRNFHEKYRGPNSYLPVINSIEFLKDAGVNYLISMTVNKLNMFDMVAMVCKYGSKLTFAPLFNAGSARKRRMCITGSAYYKALLRIKGVNPLGYCETSLENASRERICKCAIGDAEISISETGDVYPCQLLHNERFLAGNVLVQPLIDIYNSSEVLHSCRQLTVDNIKECSRCFLRYLCGGACRARAFYECGNIGSSGKFCEYEKKAFVNGIFELYSENAL